MLVVLILPLTLTLPTPAIVDEKNKNNTYSPMGAKRLTKIDETVTNATTNQNES